MVGEQLLGEVNLSLDYLSDEFTPDERQKLTDLSRLAIQQVKQDPNSTVRDDQVHEVARTLMDSASDARTLMIFFISLLDSDDIETLKPTYEPDLIEAARMVSVIRLLNGQTKPKQLPIRKVLLRQLVLKVTHDVRVIMIKIAGRLVVLRDAANWSEDARQLVSQETLEVVVPWCDALGLEKWRLELQELSFKYLDPEKYAQTILLMKDQRHLLHDVKDQVITEIKGLLERHHIDGHVSGRVKTHYAVYRKMQAYKLEYDDVWDRVGIRILTHSIFECYYVQMAIEEELYPERRRYIDLIDHTNAFYNPHYQSIHLTVGGPQGFSVEIQIRTFDMHIKGEYGMAAHWKMYGGGDGADFSEDVKFAFLRTQASKVLGDPMDYLGNALDTLLFNNSILPMDTSGFILDPETGERVKDSEGNEIYYRDAQANTKGYILDPHTHELIHSQSGDPIWYQNEILPDRVLVYTPDGDIKSLPQGATPLDFAYYIHEDVGNTCVGARVNGMMQRLDYTLQLGDQIEIINRKDARPSLDWLYNGYSRTRRAHEKIKRYFREKTDVAVPEIEDLGKSIVNKRLSAHKIRDLSVERLSELLHCKSRHELLEGVGSGEISVARLDEILGEYILDQLTQLDAPRMSQHVSHKEFDLLYAQAQCCLPLPGDDTLSYISQGRGFILHRSDCRNVRTLDAARVSFFDYPDELMGEGDHNPPAAFSSRLTLLVVTPSKTVLFIKETANTENLPIEFIKMNSTQATAGTTQITLGFRVGCKAQVDRLIRKLNTSDDILMIRRPIG